MRRIFDEQYGDLPSLEDLAFNAAMRDSCESYHSDVLEENPELDYLFWDNPSPALEVFLNNWLSRWSFREAKLDNYQKYM